MWLQDFQALCLFEVEPGVYRWGEVQVNVQDMLAIKGRPGGGHDAFKFARSIGAYSEGSYQFTGGCGSELYAQIAAGLLLKVDLNGDEAMGKDLALLGKFCEALGSPTCRVAGLR